MSDFYDLTAAEQTDRLTRLARNACDAWAFAGRPEITLLKFRENAVFRVDADGGRYALRVHRAGYHTPAALESELRWMTALRAEGVPTPEVLPTRTGALFTTAHSADVPEPRLVDLLSWVDGGPLGSVEQGVTADSAAVSAYAETGRLMARLHDHAQHWRRPDTFVRQAWDADGMLGDAPLWGRFWELDALTREDRALVLAAADRARADLAAFGDGPDRYGLIHADFLPENLMLHQGVVQVIDFDDAGFGWHLFDIATSLFLVADDPAFGQLLDAFVGGYRTRRTLPEEHLARLPLFFLLRGLTYLGWLHTRRETVTAQQMTPVLVPAVNALAAAYLAARPTARH
ncbi:phosphotransferase enzyme family protein [Streptomyces sp. NPDC001914]|uniref:phosphotransferase enzyme family protein n=1 Tax=Streptomyces sp. NPDC001914 TaxID=3364623 RepID=UPI0036B1B89E